MEVLDLFRTRYHVATRLLMNNKTLTPFATESVLGGVLERINIASGQVFHEETIGDYATFVNIADGQPESDLAETAERYATVWEQEAPKFFQYNVTADQAQERLQGYVQRANLSDSLLYGLGSLNGSSSSATSSNSNNSACAGGMQRRWGGVTFGREAEFSLLTPRQQANDTGSGSSRSNSSTVAANQTTTLYGLSLLEDGTVVPVMNSDLSFNLLYSRRPSRSLIQSVITALQP